MCIWLPLLLMLGAALLSWFACKSYLQSRIEDEAVNKNQELNDNYQSLNTDFLAYIEKTKQTESNYASLQKEFSGLQTDNHNLTLKLSSVAVEREKQAAEYQGSLAILESKFKEMETEQGGSEMAFAAAPREIIKEVFVDKIVEVPVETIREVEVIKEVFVDKIVEVEIIREIEVTREIDMNSLLAMLGQMETVEISRTTRAAEKVEEVTAAVENSVNEELLESIPIVENIAAVSLEIKKDNLIIVEGIGPKIAELLNNDGIFSFEQLANTDIATLQGILEKAGARFQMHKPDTWAEQARYAANGQFEELKAWQETLNAGRK